MVLDQDNEDQQDQQDTPPSHVINSVPETRVRCDDIQWEDYNNNVEYWNSLPAEVQESISHQVALFATSHHDGKGSSILLAALSGSMNAVKTALASDCADHERLLFDRRFIALYCHDSGRDLNETFVSASNAYAMLDSTKDKAHADAKAASDVVFSKIWAPYFIKAYCCISRQVSSDETIPEAFRRAVVMAMHFVLSLDIRDILLQARTSPLSGEELIQISKLESECQAFECAIKSFGSVTNEDFDNFKHLEAEHAKLFSGA